jgi:hypothetical protein
MKTTNTPQEPTKPARIRKEVLKRYDDPKLQRRYYISGIRKFWVPLKKAS